MDMVQNERWATAPGMLGNFEVSDQGRVRRATPGKGVTVGQIMKSTDHGAYGHQCLVKPGESGKIEKFYVHRLVALAFIGEPPEGMPLIRHLDGNARNNVVSNLAWGTAAENSLDMLSMGRSEKANRKACPKGHPYAGENLQTTRRTYRGQNPERVCKTCVTAARKTGLEPGDYRHGTRTGYLKSCRCEPCTTAKREYDHAWYAARKLRIL